MKGDGELENGAGFEAYFTYKGIKDFTWFTGLGYDTGTGWSYFPSAPELLVTFGMFAIEVLGYIVITRRFPVLPREDAPPTATPAALRAATR